MSEIYTLCCQWEHLLLVEVTPQPIANGPHYALPLNKKTLSILVVQELHKFVLCPPKGRQWNDYLPTYWRIE